MGTYDSVAISWRMISSGKMGANTSGPTGSLVAGLRGGASSNGRSGTMLYQLSGNDPSSSLAGLLACVNATVSGNCLYFRLRLWTSLQRTGQVGSGLV